MKFTWEINGVRLDGKPYSCRQFHDRKPALNDEIDITDDETGRVIFRAKIGGVTEHPSKGAGLGILQISANEIDLTARARAAG